MIADKPKNCCGCTACEWVCPQRAIRMVTDPLGFLLPEVDKSLCIGCGLCEKLCPFITNTQKEDAALPLAYAARHKNTGEIDTSRSGAVFTAVSSFVISRGGVVYGAAFADDCSVEHQKASDYIEMFKFKGSKYTQSDMRGIIRDLYAELQRDRMVLFSGTPCQISAIRNLVPHKYKENLYLVDVVCHGAAAPRVWADYIRYLEKRERRKIVKADFRDKSIYGWDGLHRESFLFDNNKKHTYPITFYQPFLIREACSVCPYATTQRVSDLTLGDLWEWESVCPTMNEDKKGISLVLVNTDKGQELLDSVAGDLDVRKIPLDDCLQLNLQNPTPRDPRADAFAKDYRSHGWEYTLAKYYPVSWTDKIKYGVKRVLGRV